MTLCGTDKVIEKQAFDLVGFTKIVTSGGEQYDDVRKSGKWDILRQIAGDDKTIFGIGSYDKETPKDHYRYTLAVIKPADLTRFQAYEPQLYSFHVKPSRWCVFTFDHFGRQYGKFWGQNPYQMIKDLGFTYNTVLNLHLDVYPEAFQTDDDEMEFWMPIKS